MCGVVDLRDEQQCVFEIELVGGNERVQFACANRELQQRWIAAVVNAQAIPVRCTLIRPSFTIECLAGSIG